MKKFPTVSKMAAVAAIAGFVFSNSFATSATIQNGDFETYIAESDSFPFWTSDKDSTGGTRFDISQETVTPHTLLGCLKMEILPGADTTTEFRVSGGINNLPAKKIVTITLWVKYENIPSYSSTSINLMQATQLQVDPWTWTFRKWTSLWYAQLGTSDWVQISMSDTTVDSANSFTLIFSHSKSGTLWVDDIAITYTDLAPVTQKAVTPARQGAVLNNRISFPRAMPYYLEVCGVNGKLILKTSGVANAVNLDRLGLVSGAYLVKAKTSEKTYNGRVVVGR